MINYNILSTIVETSVYDYNFVLCVFVIESHIVRDIEKLNTHYLLEFSWAVFNEKNPKIMTSSFFLNNNSSAKRLCNALNQRSL